MTIHPFPLRDGAAPQPRSEVIAAMTAILVKADGWRTEGDALRTLMWVRDAAGGRLFTGWEVTRYLDDVRQAAMQEAVVAKVMGAG